MNVIKRDKKRIAILSEDLLRNSGGAEAYALNLANVLSRKYDVTIFCKKGKVDKYNVFEKYHVKPMNLCEYPFVDNNSRIKIFMQRLRMSVYLKKRIKGKYNIFINTSLNRHIAYKDICCIHLVHFPAKDYCSYLPRIIGLYLNKKYKESYQLFLANSMFTHKWLKKIWGKESVILNPPIYTEPVKPEVVYSKKNYILMVGRLVPDKKIKEKIENFVQVIGKNNPSYKLVIAGNTNTGKQDYFHELKQIESINNNIEIKNDISYAELLCLYKSAKIFWHAAGYGVDEKKNPLLTEHFGMTTVEAMTQGCVPVAINKAGQKEIIINGVCGYLWNTIPELNEKTQQLIDDKKLTEEMAIKAIESSKKFTLPEFKKHALFIIDNLM